MPWYTLTEENKWQYENDTENQVILWDGLDFEPDSLLQAVELRREISVGLFKTAINSLDGLASIGGYEDMATYSLLELSIVIQIKYGLFLTKNKV